MKLLAPLLLTLLLSRAMAGPLEDLGSLDPKVRETAATGLAKEFKPIPKSTWDSLVAKLHKDLPKEELLKLLEAAGAKENPSGSSGPFEIREYKLDRDWALIAFFNFRLEGGSFKDEKLDHWTLVPGMPPVTVEPPKDFTGIWVCYFPNGKKYTEDHYEKGLKSGNCLGWYSSGVLSFEYTWKDGKEVGVWKSYDADGKLLNTFKPQGD